MTDTTTLTDPAAAESTARLKLRRTQLWLLVLTVVWFGFLVTAVVFGVSAFFSDGAARASENLAVAGTFGIAALVICAIDATVRVLILRRFRASLG